MAPVLHIWFGNLLPRFTMWLSRTFPALFNPMTAGKEALSMVVAD